jgi:serine/threonine protein kinase
LPGQTYGAAAEYQFDEKDQIKFFLSAVETLMKCHRKGYVFIDLKEDNILYDKTTGKSYLIDGGLAQKNNTVLRESVFLKNNQDEIDKVLSSSFHMAPECFSTQEVLAKESMDVYSLGSMMGRVLIYPSDTLNKLIKECQCATPGDRLSLEDLRAKLMEYYEERLKIENRQEQPSLTAPVRQKTRQNQVESVDVTVFSQECLHNSTIRQETPKIDHGGDVVMQTSPKSLPKASEPAPVQSKSLLNNSFLLSVFCHPALILLGYLIPLLGELIKTIPERGVGSPSLINQASAVRRDLFNLKKVMQIVNERESPTADVFTKPSR